MWLTFEFAENSGSRAPILERQDTQCDESRGDSYYDYKADSNMACANGQYSEYDDEYYDAHKDEQYPERSQQDHR